MSPASYKNKLISQMKSVDFERLRPHFERVSITKGEVLLRRGHPIDFVYFIETGQASALACASRSHPIEVSMIGCEGMTDFMLSGRSACETIVQMDGEAVRIARPIFMQAVEHSLSLALLVLRYQQALMMQIAFTALSHGAYTLKERLARYILMADDRADGRDLPFVHEFLSWMLAVRRAGVSEALARLVQDGAIMTGRGKVRIVERSKLVELARGSYGHAEAEYQKLMQPLAAPH